MKSHGVTEWITKQETHFRVKDTHRLKVMGLKKIFCVHGNDKLVRVAVLISVKIDFKTNVIRENKDGHYIVRKGSVQEKDINPEYSLEGFMLKLKLKYFGHLMQKTYHDSGKD